MKRRQSIRLPFYDYSWPGEYFITIITHRRRAYFGLPDETNNEVLALRSMVEEIWEALFSGVEEVLAINKVLMPNHFHCLIQLTKDNGKTIDHYNIKERRRMTIPMLVGKVKMQSSKAINDHFESLGKGRPFKWQRNYFERVVRNDRESVNVYNYIENNPVQW